MILGVSLGVSAVIISPLEKKGGRLVSNSMEKLTQFIDENEPIDLPLSGVKYTWSNNRRVLRQVGSTDS